MKPCVTGAGESRVRGRDMESVLASGETRGEGRILRWAVCLTRAVAHLHAKMIVHQDLKPANIRLNPNDDPVLLDFGAARDYSMVDGPGEDRPDLDVAGPSTINHLPSSEYG